MASSKPKFKPRQKVTYARTAAGLRDALFAELEDLHNGVSSPHEAVAFAKIADSVIATGELELRSRMFTVAQERQAMIDRQEQKLLPAPDDFSADPAEFVDGDEDDALNVMRNAQTEDDVIVVEENELSDMSSASGLAA